MTFRFLHLADVHLDSAYGGRASTRARLRAATLEAFVAAVTFALRERVDAVLLAGDAFDETRLSHEARLVLRQEAQRLAHDGIALVYATGNHDPGGPRHAAANLGLPKSPLLHTILDGDPRVVTIERAGAPIATVSACGHATASVSDALARRLRAPGHGTHRAAAAPSPLAHVAVLHTQVGSARGADGHARYAPSSVLDLAAGGFAYWALGHVHVRGRVDPSIPAWYSGNLQGRNPREAGPKGGLLVEVDAGGLLGDPEFVAFAPVEFMTVDLAVERVRSGNAAPTSPLDRATAIARGVAREAWQVLASPGREGALAPKELVVRAQLDLSGDPLLQRAFDDASERDLLEDAVRAELVLAAGDSAFPDVLEVQLRRAARVSSPTADVQQALPVLRDEIERTPSALRAALRLADAIQNSPELAEGLSIEWAAGAPDGHAGRVRELLAGDGPGLAQTLLERLAVLDPTNEQDPR